MWNLQSEEKDKRTYINSTTGSKCITQKVYTDIEGNNWFEFEDLLTLPITRQFAASKIISLYALGFTKDDLNNHISGLKTILKSNDPEKYEKAFANLIDFETKAGNAADPLRQQSAMVPVYYTINDEAIDSFETALQLKKMLLLEAEPAMHSFFLSRQVDAIESYMSHLNKLSQTVSAQLPELSGASL